MDFEQLYHFVFETYAGIGVLFLVTIIVCLVACIVMERRTRRVYKDRPAAEGDEWSVFEDEEEDD